MSKNASYEQLERAIIAWAQEQETVRAMLVVGSHARPDHPADEWSDLDLILFTNDPARYTTGPSWLEETGQIWLAVSGSTGCGDPEWDVIYASGDKADWVIVSVAGCMQMSLPEWIAASPYSFVLERGLRILDDKTRPGPANPARVIFPIPRRRYEPPTEQQFNQAVQAALLAAARAARHLRRLRTGQPAAGPGGFPVPLPPIGRRDLRPAGILLSTRCGRTHGRVDPLDCAILSALTTILRIIMQDAEP